MDIASEINNIFYEIEQRCERLENENFRLQNDLDAALDNLVKLGFFKDDARRL